MKRLMLVNHHISNDFRKIQLEKRDSIGYIFLNNPKGKNCFSKMLYGQLDNAFRQLQNDENINVIVLMSKVAGMFSSGMDIKEISKGNYEYIVREQPLHFIQEVIKRVKKPIIAGVNGLAIGGGFQLALMCDIILGSQQSYFAFPQVKLGLMPGLGGTQRLCKIVGQKKAMKCILCGQGFSAEQAYQFGIMEKVSSDNFEEDVNKIAKKIASKALTTMIVTKKAVKHASNTTLNQGLDYEKALGYSMLASKAFKQGCEAFLNKRKPNFKGL